LNISLKRNGKSILNNSFYSQSLDGIHVAHYEVSILQENLTLLSPDNTDKSVSFFCKILTLHGQTWSYSVVSQRGLEMAGVSYFIVFLSTK